MVATLHQERMSSIDVLSWVVLAQAGHRVPGIASALLLVTLPCGPSKFDGVGYHARGTWWESFSGHIGLMLRRCPRDEQSYWNWTIHVMAIFVWHLLLNRTGL